MSSKIWLACAVPRSTVLIDEPRFVDWLSAAEPGDAVVYYRGQLGSDRMPSASPLQRGTRDQLDALARRVIAAEAQGLVLPTQLRLGRGDYVYLAVKAARSRARPRWLASISEQLGITARNGGAPTRWPSLAAA